MSEADTVYAKVSCGSLAVIAEVASAKANFL